MNPISAPVEHLTIPPRAWASRTTAGCPFLPGDGGMAYGWRLADEVCFGYPLTWARSEGLEPPAFW